ncbi:hypothetical protein [Streptomyces nigrescens]|uniref:hypothetical protein n=1 Tax=Streptomyces nigrescens TaxID=1920 RepID=UPI0036F97231
MHQDRTVVDIRSIDSHSHFQADDLLVEHADAYTRLVQAILAAAPNGELGGVGANHTITDPATDNTVGGGCFPEYVVRSLTRVFNEAADRMLFADDLTALMDAISEPTARPALHVVAGGAR